MLNLQAGNSDSLGTELLESLLKMAPTKEEEWKLKEFKDESPFKLGPAEKFLKAVLDVPYAFKRVDAMLYIANFDSEVDYLKRSFETLEVNNHMLPQFFICGVQNKNNLAYHPSTCSVPVFKFLLGYSYNEFSVTQVVVRL